MSGNFKTRGPGGARHLCGVLFAAVALWGQSPAAQIDEAIALANSGSARQGLAILRGVIPRLRESHDEVNLARALAASSEAALTVGDYEGAVQSSTEAARLHAKTSDADAEATDWNTIGRANVYLGRYVPAIESYQRALALDRKRGDAEGEIVRLYNIGNVYFEQGRYLDAFRQYQTALERLDATAGEEWNARRRQIVMANLAILYQRLGRYQQALQLYLSLREHSESMKPSERAQLVSNLGTLYRRLGDSGKALETYRQAQALFQQDHHPFGESGVLKNIGIVLALDLDRLPEALKAFQDAQKLATQSAGGQLAAIQLYIGETYRELGRYDEARASFEAALAGSRQGGSSEYEWQALRGLGQIEEQAGRRDEALRLYLDAIARIESVRSGLELPVLRREFLGDKRQVYDAALEILLARPEPPVGQVFELMEHSRARVMQDRLASPGAKYGLKEIQTRLDPGSVLLEYWVGRSGGAVLYATRSEAGILPRAAVDPGALRTALEDSGSSWREISSRIGHALLSGIPALRSGEFSSVIVVPDGSLSLIPFELLAAGDSGDAAARLLVERAPLFYLPSASLLLRAPSVAVRGWGPPWRRELLAFADPAQPSADAGADAIGGDTLRWAALPGSSDEVRAIAGLLPGRAELHLAADATKPLLLARATAAPLLHVSTHAIADPIDPERSRILFAPPQPRAGADYLFLREIYGLDLKGLDMVVLSACDTETGKVTGGEGVEGFSKAFLAAGANSTVTTLWPVDDRATAEFMKQFYYALASGSTKAEALRQAKLQFLRSGSRLSHPQYWAAFVLNGDGLAPIPRAISWSTVGIAAGAIGLTVLLGVSLRRTSRARAALTGSRS
jgi:tetratricopeptide (TPR) repeat protein